MTLSQIKTLTEHPHWGAVAKTLTIDDIRDAVMGRPQASVAQAGKSKRTAPKTSAKAPKTSAKAKAPNAKKAAPPKTSKKASTPAKGGGHKLDHEKGQREVLAAIKAGKDKLAAIVSTTKYTPAQCRMFCQELLSAGKVKMNGAGRGTTWTVA